MDVTRADARAAMVTLDLPADGAPSSNGQRFLDYWRSLPKDGLVPRRASFDPTAVVPLLPDLVLCSYEFGPPPKVVFSLIGSRHVDRWGRNLTGHDYLAFLPERDRDAAWRRLRNVVAWPCGSHGYRAEVYRSGKVVLLETLILPLRGREGRVDSCIAYSREAPGHEKPHWDFSIGCEFRAMTRERYLDIGNGVPEPEARRGAE